MMGQEPSRGTVGWITFAGIMMIVAGGFSVLQGIGWFINASNFPDSALSSGDESGGTLGRSNVIDQARLLGFGERGQELGVALVSVEPLDDPAEGDGDGHP